VEANRGLDGVSQFVADLQIFWRERAADASGLQIVMESLAECLILGRVADEAGVELDRPATLPHTTDVRGGPRKAGTACARWIDNNQAQRLGFETGLFHRS
jgi:hypothetical protein